MELIKSIDWVSTGYAIFLMLVGLVIAKRLSALIGHGVAKRFSLHQAMLIKRLVFYGLILVFLIAALQQLGFKLTVLLGAAGVFTVALSFASQTAASNLVSGLFLLFECPFKVGDLIRVKETLGTVDSIDLLSTKLVTPDHLLIRIPNETIIKSEILNMSYFDTRRVDMIVGVSYNADFEHVKSVLLQIAAAHDDILKTPEPQVVMSGFEDSSVDIKFMVWTNTPNAFAVRNQLNQLIKQRFDEEQIEIPYPQMTLHQAN